MITFQPFPSCLSTCFPCCVCYGNRSIINSDMALHLSLARRTPLHCPVWTSPATQCSLSIHDSLLTQQQHKVSKNSSSIFSVQINVSPVSEPAVLYTCTYSVECCTHAHSIVLSAVRSCLCVHKCRVYNCCISSFASTTVVGPRFKVDSCYSGSHTVG